MIARPTVLPAAGWTFPTPAVTTLDNGLTVWAYDLPGQLILSCDLVLEVPLNAEPAGKEGVATIAVRTLDEGTLAHPGTGFATALEGVGAQFSGLVGQSTTQCLLDVPYDSLDEALVLFAEVVTTPGFDSQDVARITSNRLAEIEQQESRGAFLASTALRKTLLDSRLRIARPIGGDTDQVSGLTPDDVTGFHAWHYGSQQATLIIAGDLSGIDTMGSVRRAFEAWGKSGTSVAPEPIRAGQPRRQLIHRDGAVQTDVRLGWYGVDRKDPRWHDLQVAVTIMGGMFNSRLNQILREERGYTYAVSMNARPFRAGGIIDLATSTRTEATADLVAETLKILRADTPFSDEEVRQAISYLTQSAPLSFDTAEAITAQAATLAAARLDLDHVTTALAALNKVTPHSAMDAYRSLVDPDTVSIVAVADTSELTDPGFEPS
ncbi:MAG: insulinase family protein [Propionibacteriaceae bacterium]|nr:insulinase family protein [Propionibacteriaceae bacterium]